MIDEVENPLAHLVDDAIEISNMAKFFNGKMYEAEDEVIAMTQKTWKMLNKYDNAPSSIVVVGSAMQMILNSLSQIAVANTDNEDDKHAVFELYAFAIGSLLADMAKSDKKKSVPEHQS